MDKRRILVLIVVATLALIYVGAPVLSDEDYDVFFWGVLVSAVIAGASFLYFSGRRRRDALRQLAVSSGYTFEPKWQPLSTSRLASWLSGAFRRGARSIPEVPDGLDRVPILDLTRPGTKSALVITNVIRGSASGTETLLFDYHATLIAESAHWLGIIGMLVGMVVPERGIETRKHTVAAFRLPQGALPAFELHPRHWATMWARRTDFHEVHFDNPKFTKRYVVCGGDEPAVRSVFTPEVLEHLLQNRSPCSAEGAAHWVVVYRPHGYVDVHEVRWFLEEAHHVAGIFGATMTALEF